MAVALLVRHGRTTANAGGVLAGWSPGVHLDDVGREQARALGERLAPAAVVRVVTSPLDRCLQTAQGVLGATDVPLVVDERLGEARYGDWTGRRLSDLARTALWRTVQEHPSAVVFPGADGEAMAHVQARAVEAVREHDRAVTHEHGPDAVWVVVSHGDVIKAVLADALGTHLDLFQRIVVDPASVSAVRYTPTRPFVLRTNDVSGSWEGLARRRRRRGRRSDAAVGGGAGDS
jgi:probable phosphomutase (TIGR03848 family)